MSTLAHTKRVGLEGPQPPYNTDIDHQDIAMEFLCGGVEGVVQLTAWQQVDPAMFLRAWRLLKKRGKATPAFAVAIIHMSSPFITDEAIA